MKLSVGSFRLEIDAVGILAMVVAIIGVARYRDPIHDLIRRLTGQPAIERDARRPTLTLAPRADEPEARKA